MIDMGDLLKSETTVRFDQLGDLEVINKLNLEHQNADQILTHDNYVSLFGNDYKDVVKHYKVSRF
jgi:hypothetical protein